METKKRTTPRILDESKAAEALGLRVFISQTQCKKKGCGSYERRVANEGQTGCVCVACDRLRAKNYRELNGDACRKRTLKWHQIKENKEYHKLYQKGLRARKKEELLQQQDMP